MNLPWHHLLEAQDFCLGQSVSPQAIKGEFSRGIAALR